MTDKAKYARLVDGETKLMGVLGHGIAYTQSPRLHNFAANQLGLNIAYLPIDLPEAAVKPFLDAAWAMGAVGFSVTKPHKGLVARLLPKSPLTSVNTLFRGKTWWEGASTDGEGFVAGLGRLDVDFAQFREITIIGSGGATGALLETFSRVARQDLVVTVLRRNPRHDAALAQALPKSWTFICQDLGVDALTHVLQGKDAGTLLVQASSAPQNGDDLKILEPALRDFRGVLVDLVYGKPSSLYFAAIAKNLICQDGEAMLIEQARLAQKLWWGRSLPYEDMAVALRGK